MHIFGIIGSVRYMIPKNHAFSLNARKNSIGVEEMIAIIRKPTTKPTIYSTFEIAMQRKDFNETVFDLQSIDGAGRAYFTVIDLKNNEGIAIEKGYGQEDLKFKFVSPSKKWYWLQTNSDFDDPKPDARKIAGD